MIKMVQSLLISILFFTLVRFPDITLFLLLVFVLVGILFAIGEYCAGALSIVPDVTLSENQASPASLTSEEVTLEDWRHFANDIGIPANPTLNRLWELAESIPAAARESRAAFAKQHGDEAVYDKFERYIQLRCQWVLKQLARRKGR